MKQLLDNEFSREEFINKKLYKIVEKNALSNAYIFYGPDNIGKKESAQKFISEIIKRNTSDLNIFTKLKDNNYPDYLMIEPTYLIKGNILNRSDIDITNNQKTKPIIRIEQIRRMKDFLSKASIQSEKKFVLINDAHLLNEAASNCLLKTLEEPVNAIFILLTSKFNLLLDTIISRCQIIRFRSYSNKELNNFLENSKNSTKYSFLDRQNLDTLIFISNGSPGRLINNINLWNEIPDNIKDNIKSPLNSYQEILLLAKYISKELNIYQQEFLIDFIQRNWWDQTKNKKLIEILEGIKLNINANIQPRLSWEVGLLKTTIEDI